VPIQLAVEIQNSTDRGILVRSVSDFHRRIFRHVLQPHGAPTEAEAMMLVACMGCTDQCFVPLCPVAVADTVHVVAVDCPCLACRLGTELTSANLWVAAREAATRLYGTDATTSAPPNDHAVAGIMAICARCLQTKFATKIREDDLHVSQI
jgi:hypothetical protein